MIVTALLATTLAVPALPAAAAAPRLEARQDAVVAVATAARADSVEFAVSQRTRDRLNRLIRAAMPMVCPLLVRTAEPAFRSYLDLTCKQIASAPDPLMVITEFLPLACAGDPPMLALVYPKLERVVRGSCPLLLKLPKILGVK